MRGATRWLAMSALASTAGCNLVFGLDAPAGDGDDDVIDARIADANRPDGPPGDMDSDGIADGVDNCPADQNTNQHDEDQDFYGDVCDNCPHFANEGQSDAGDGDGVGDACDPNRLPSGDHLLIFDPFVALDPRWNMTLGEWMVGNDHLISGPTGTQIISSTEMPTGALVITSLTYTTVPSAAEAGIYLSLDRTVPAMPFGYVCQTQYAPINTTTGNARLQINKFIAVGGATPIIDTPMSPMTIGTTYGLAFSLADNVLNCVFTGEMGDVPAAAVDSQYPSGRVGLRVRDATVAFGFIAVYE